MRHRYIPWQGFPLLSYLFPCLMTCRRGSNCDRTGALASPAYVFDASSAIIIIIIIIIEHPNLYLLLVLQVDQLLTIETGTTGSDTTETRSAAKHRGNA